MLGMMPPFPHVQPFTTALGQATQAAECCQAGGLCHLDAAEAMQWAKGWETVHFIQFLMCIPCLCNDYTKLVHCKSESMTRMEYLSSRSLQQLLGGADETPNLDLPQLESDQVRSLSRSKAF